MFARMEMSEDELMEDPECLAGLRVDPNNPPFKDKRSVIYTYTYPVQETKLRYGSNVTRADNANALGDTRMDVEAKLVPFKVGPSKEAPPPLLSIGRAKPISTAVIQDALFRFADTLVSGDHRYPALESVLRRDLPSIASKAPEAPMIEGVATVEACSKVVLNMQYSQLFIQGLPGAGKTYTGSHVIVALLAAGKRWASRQTPIDPSITFSRRWSRWRRNRACPSKASRSPPKEKTRSIRAKASRTSTTMMRHSRAVRTLLQALLGCSLDRALTSIWTTFALMRQGRCPWPT